MTDTELQHVEKADDYTARLPMTDDSGYSEIRTGPLMCWLDMHLSIKCALRPKTLQSCSDNCRYRSDQLEAIYMS